MATSGMDFSKLLSQIDAVTTKKTYDNKDENFWKPTKDKSGNAAAVIRFLPNKDVEDFPFVRLWSHSFKCVSTGRWYIENSLSTIGGQDYIGTINQGLWNSGLDESKETCRLQKRKLSYVSNILVIKDLGNPENNGKVFKYKYGAKIFEKIVNAAKPDEALGEEAINAFDVEAGADFLLKMQKANDQFNYDASKFNASKPLFDGNEKKVQEVLDQCFDLNLEIAPDKFKSEKELKSKYLWATGQEKTAAPTQDEDTDAEIAALTKVVQKEKAAPVAPKTKKAPPIATAADGDDDAAFFSALIED